MKLMNVFKRKVKMKKHILRDVAIIPSYCEYNRALRCETCGKQFIMDMFGGWAIEWDFKVVDNGWKVDSDDIKEAVKKKYSMLSSQWIIADTVECNGSENTP